MWSTSQSQSSTLMGGSGRPKGFLALIGLSPSSGSDSPSSLTAKTLKLYSSPSSSPSTSKKSGHLSPAVLPFFTHFLVLGQSISMTYSWMGLPPSSSGGFHLSLQ